jgi:riboflavin kinase/FMN adenylyltransferase
MKRCFDLEEARRDSSPPGGRVVTVGLFDGLHLGHRHLLAELAAWARSLRAGAAAVTFDPHPQSVLRGSAPVPVLSLEHRLLLLARSGIETALVLRFDRELASWPPEVFVRRALREALGARGLLLGFDSAVGRGREGSYEYLKAREVELEIEVRRGEAFRLEGERVSSTLVRQAVARGDLRRLEALLGRPFAQLGRVVPGDRRGRELGFPTANLDPGGIAMLPAGVYFAAVRRLGAHGAERRKAELELHDDGPLLPAVVNIGRRPTVTGEREAEEGEPFDPARDRVEVHILDFAADLYGGELEVIFLERHRAERRFASLEELATQIRRDVAARRAYAGG